VYSSVVLYVYNTTLSYKLGQAREAFVVVSRRALSA
jgi:hypothetical protein